MPSVSERQAMRFAERWVKEWCDNHGKVGDKSYVLKRMWLRSELLGVYTFEFEYTRHTLPKMRSFGNITLCISSVKVTKGNDGWTLAK